MARIEAAPEIVEDLDRILDHLAQFDVAGGPSRIEEILHAVRCFRAAR